MTKQPSSDNCPFGIELQKYWDRRYELFSRFDQGVQTDAEGLYSVIPEEVGLNQAKLIKGKHVLDAFCGIGGSAIAFARSDKRVTAIEISGSRLEMAEHNAKVYGVTEQIRFIQGNFLELVTSIEADTINLDPPWGGPEYKKLGRFLLQHFSPDGNALLDISLKYFKEIVLRVPVIFDLSELHRFPVHYRTYDDVSSERIISKTLIISHQKEA